MNIYMLKLTVFLSLMPFFSFCQLDCNSNNIDANNICRVLYSTAASPNAATNFEDFLVNLIKGETSYSEREKAEIVSGFFNKNNSCLICGDDSDVKIRENEHLLKRSISSNGYQFLEKVVTSEYYYFDFNYYEIVDGEK
ncbi:MAG: hypothetical protein AAFQ94_29920 [Bacteroidota bacterium]